MFENNTLKFWMSIMVGFVKYHGLGNDYLVIDPKDIALEDLTQEVAAAICDRHYGVGADGILYGPIFKGEEMHMVIYNADGSFAENCGNGLRIFGQSLFDNGYVEDTKFTVHIEAGAMDMEIIDLKKNILKTFMGGFSLRDKALSIDLGGEIVTGTALSVGNPHFVTFVEETNEALARRLGPQIEHHEAFPNRTNCQFVEVIDRNTINIQIWERGSEYTLASGSSSTACACAAFVNGYCDKDITVNMPGGTLQISIIDEDHVYLTGPVQKVMSGRIDLDLNKVNGAVE